VKNELIIILLFISSFLLIGQAAPIVSNPTINPNEVVLAFSLVFTFAVGMEVVK